MLLIWKIRYLDSQDRLFKDRDLMLDTDSLDPVTKAVVEEAYELRDTRERDFIRFRHLFSERKLSGDEMNELILMCGGINSFCLPRYFEDEHGRELTNKQMAFNLSGNSNSIMFPAGTPRHYIDYALSGKPPVPLDKISLSQDQLNTLGYFARDLREMLASAFCKDGPGSLSGSSMSQPYLQTAVDDEEIRSFVSIFRRLYMAKEPANFLKTVQVFGQVLGEHPLGNLVTGIGKEFERDLGETPDLVPWVTRDSVQFSRKRLIDVFLYTRYAHQPRKDRERQFKECLAAVDNKNDVLTWLFLTELSICASHVCNAGSIIADFLDHYCRYHKVSPGIIASIATEHPGLGKIEKKQDKQDRIFEEKVKEVAKYLWDTKGQPPGGPEQFIDDAKGQLKTFRE